MKKLARRHQQQQEQQNSQRLGQGRGFVKKQSERERICSCLEVSFPRDTSVQQSRPRAGLWVRKQSPSVHQQWKGLRAPTGLLQILHVGSDPRRARAEAVTSFLVEMCHVEVFALEEISRRLTPDRSSSLFSSAVRGTVLSWNLHRCQHCCPSQGPPVSPQVSGPWGRHYSEALGLALLLCGYFWVSPAPKTL